MMFSEIPYSHFMVKTTLLSLEDEHQILAGESGFKPNLTISKTVVLFYYTIPQQLLESGTGIKPV